MNDTKPQPRAITRTWDTVTHDRMDGAVVQVRHHTVTLSCADGVLTAEIDGQPADERDARHILRGATFRAVTAEVLEPEVIGKPAAWELHRALGRAGIPSKEHYGYASAALDRPVYSLALLTADESESVLLFLAFTHGIVARAEVAA
ncbi:hypothetical protein [Deinococcus sp. Leaf326]|uniref:hypothetical protein n=1 Tax=Deinococcus sp. Leaf326 TaxID=1736338 RepID=UPI0006F4D076|nr:hypothetical protein [Deinococcus sp. Leaf326]KQR40721.1 hypothetical protein ASF71_00710 [Deinococcus sp. Leaf326]